MREPNPLGLEGGLPEALEVQRVGQHAVEGGIVRPPRSRSGNDELSWSDPGIF